jgi:hypothetical protein
MPFSGEAQITQRQLEGMVRGSFKQSPGFNSPGPTRPAVTESPLWLKDSVEFPF